MNELPQTLSCTYGTDISHNILAERRVVNPLMGHSSYNIFNTNHKIVSNKATVEEKKVSNRRLVKVMIVDPDENVPVSAAVLVNEPEKITDLDDQELFFELDVKNILDSHNDYRASIKNKKKSTPEVDVYLEPVRIRDLKMVVLTIAEF